MYSPIPITHTTHDHLPNSYNPVPDNLNLQTQLTQGFHLGSISLLKDTQFLTENPGIRLLICVSSHIPALFTHTYSVSPIYRCLTYDPSIRVSRVSQLLKICETITLCQAASNGRVECLVFCEDGDGMSALVGACYLIYCRGKSVGEAVNEVRKVRRNARFDEQQVQVLVTFWEYCLAGGRVNGRADSGKVSRQRDDDDDDNEDSFNTFEGQGRKRTFV